MPSFIGSVTGYSVPQAVTFALSNIFPTESLEIEVLAPVLEFNEATPLLGSIDQILVALQGNPINA